MGNEIVRKTEVQLENPGIAHLRSILLPDESNRRRTALFDLDDTLKELRRTTWIDGVSRRVIPETVNALSTAHTAGVCLGLVTEQSFSEIEPFLTDIARLMGKEQYELFNGVIVGEGGTVVLKRLSGGTPYPCPVFTKQYSESRERLLTWLRGNLSQEADSEGWRALTGVNPENGTTMQLAPDDEQGEVTVTVWEKGPHIGIDPVFDKRYEENRKRIRLALKEQGIMGWNVFEAGNGTIRIVPEGRDKAHMLRMLSIIDGISLKDTVYFCDGPNDIALAEFIKSKGGGVVAVGNAVGRIHQLADYSAIQYSGLGVAEAIREIFVR